MIGHASLRPPVAHPVSLQRPAITPWQRRAVEAGVSVLAFAVWGTLAYKGGYRIIARLAGVPLGGHVIIDILSLVIGVSGSIAGMSALWAMTMRALGRTPASLIGAPDDNAIDAAYRDELGDDESTILRPTDARSADGGAADGRAAQGARRSTRGDAPVATSGTSAARRAPHADSDV